MLKIECLEPKFQPYVRRTKKVADWLMQRFHKRSFLLEVALVGDKTLKKNVLAFPAHSHFPRPDLPARSGRRQKSLGEIYLNPGIIEKQGWLFEYMALHGFLHLIGYDHMKKSDRIKMERLESELLAALPFK